MGINRRSITLTALAALLQVTLVTPSAGAVAAGGECGQAGTDNGRFFDGKLVYPQAPFMNEVSADIQLRQFGLCTTKPDSGSYWVMIAAYGQGSGYAQVGYQHDSNGYAYFWQYRLDNNPWHGTSWGAPSLQDYHTFDVSRDNPSQCTSTTGYCLVMRKDGNMCHTEGSNQICELTTWDPHNKWGGSVVEMLAEAPYAGQDAPGSPGVTADYLNVFEKDAQTITSENWTQVTDCAFYKHDDVVNYSRFDLYTNPVSGHASVCT